MINGPRTTGCKLKIWVRPPPRPHLVLTCSPWSKSLHRVGYLLNWKLQRPRENDRRAQDHTLSESITHEAMYSLCVGATLLTRACEHQNPVRLVGYSHNCLPTYQLHNLWLPGMPKPYGRLQFPQQNEGDDYCRG